MHVAVPASDYAAVSRRHFEVPSLCLIKRSRLYMFRKAVSYLIFASVAVTARAQVERDTTVVLGEIVVIDSLALREGDRSLHISRLSDERLALRSGESVADLLYAESFLFVSRAGPSGLATVSLRGAGSTHTQIILDGFRLIDPQSGQLDLTMLPVAFVQSITIGHGAAFSESGYNALGGLISLRGIRPTSEAGYRISSTVGAYGRRQLGGSVSLPWRTMRTLIAFDGSKFDGDFPYTDPSTVRRAVRHRQGADRSARNLYARVEGETSLGNWFWAVWFSDGQRGIPGPANADPIWARQKDRSVRIWGGKEMAVRGGSLRLGLSYVRSSLIYFQATRDIHDRFRTETFDIRTNGRHALSPKWWIEHSSTVGIDQTDLREGQQQLRIASRVSATRQASRISITPSLAVVAYRTREDKIFGFLPSLSARFQPVRTSGFTIHSSIARVIRTPTFNERYWIPGGNPNLKSENGWSADFGISLQKGSRTREAAFETVLFVSDLRDKIVWRPGLAGPSIQMWTPDNIGRTWGRGIESSFTIRHSVGKAYTFLGRVMHTFSRVEDRSDRETRSYGNQVRYVPQHVFKSIISVGSDRFGIDVIFSLTGKRFVTSDETQFLPAIRDATIRLSVTEPIATGRLRLVVAVENATDQSIESIRFYPMPPRHVRVSIVFESGH